MFAEVEKIYVILTDTTLKGICWTFVWLDFSQPL